MSEIITHRATGHWEGPEDRQRYVSDGPLCGAKEYHFGSADWDAVDCPECLRLREAKK